MFKMKDFGNEDYSGDCFELVGRLNGLSCKELKSFCRDHGNDKPCSAFGAVRT